MNNYSSQQNLTAYEQLTVCSNLLSGGGQILVVGQEFPIIIGKGSNGAPLVWLKALVGNPSNRKRKFEEIVKASVATHSAVNVRRQDSSIEVFVGGKRVLHVSEENGSHAIVKFLDLRNIGLDLIGDENALHAGGGSFSGNSATGITALIAFDDGSQEQTQERLS